METYSPFQEDKNNQIQREKNYIQMEKIKPILVLVNTNFKVTMINIFHKEKCREFF